MTGASVTTRSTRPRSRWVVVLLLGAMVAATQQLAALSVLSTFVVDEFGLSRSAFGLLVALSPVASAVVARSAGSFADRDARTALLALFGAATVGTLLTAVAPSFAVLVVATFLSGMSVGGANPITNRLVFDKMALRHRGVAVGIKQTGPPMSTMLAGFILPTLALMWGWRGAVATVSLIAITGLVSTLLWIPPTRSTRLEPRSSRSFDDSSKQFVRRLSLISVGIGIGNGGVLAFLPLYGQEVVGLTSATAGAAAAVMGLSGVVGRVLLAPIGNRNEDPKTVLTGIAAVATIAVIALWLAYPAPPMIWVGASLAGLSIQGWHSVAWLAVINGAGSANVGRATGTVQAAQSIGFGAGPVLLGLTADWTGDYVVGWATLVAVFIVVTGISAGLRRPNATAED